MVVVENHHKTSDLVRTEENYDLKDNLAVIQHLQNDHIPKVLLSCSCCIINAVNHLGVESIMVTHDVTTLNLGTTFSHEYE